MFKNFNKFGVHLSNHYFLRLPGVAQDDHHARAHLLPSVFDAALKVQVERQGVRREDEGMAAWIKNSSKKFDSTYRLAPPLPPLRIGQGTPPSPPEYPSLSPAGREASWAPMEICFHISIAIITLTKILISFPHTSILTLFFLELQPKTIPPPGGPRYICLEDEQARWREGESTSVGR